MRRGHRRAWGIALLCTLTVGLTGCWDQMTLTQRATALSLSVSPASSGQLRWTVAFPNPTVTVSSLSNVASSGEQYYTLQATARTLDQAYQRIQARLARSLYLGQLQVLVVSSRIPAQTLRTVANTYTQNGTLPATALVVATDTPHAPIITPEQSVPTTYWTKYFACPDCHAMDLHVRIWTLWTAFQTPGISPTLPDGSGNVLTQILVYRPTGQPIRFSRAETLGWALLTNHVHKTAVTVRGPASVRDIATHATTQCVPTPHRLDVRVHIRATGAVSQWPHTPPDPARDLPAIQTQVAQRLARDCRLAIQRAQATQTDPFGWGRLDLLHHPSIYATHPLPGRPLGPWTAQVTVTVTLHNTGVTL